MAAIDDWIEKMRAQGFERAVLHDTLSPEIYLISNLIALHQVKPDGRIWALARINEVIYIWRGDGTVIGAVLDLGRALAAVRRDACEANSPSARPR